jgi:hypothetical protein
LCGQFLKKRPERRWNDKNKMGVREIGCRDGTFGTGSGSCPVAGFGISGVEASGSATRGLVN